MEKETDALDQTKELETKGIGRLLWIYALPAVISQIIASVYNMVDRIFLGQCVGSLAIAGLAITLPLMNIVHAFGSLVGAGASSRMSIVLGRKDVRWAEKILGNSVWLTLFFGLLFMSGGYGFMDRILTLFGASADTIAYAREYMYIVLPGMFLTTLTFNLTGLIRASGYPNKSMFILAGGALLNIALDALFIYGLDWGIAGAAWATTTSMAVSSLFAVAHFVQPRSFIRFKRHCWEPKLYIFRNILLIGMSPFLMNLAGSAVVALLNRQLIAYGGDMAVGAYGAVNSYALFVLMLFLGLCQGMQPIAGYNYGAGHSDRLKRVYFLTLLCCASIGFIGASLAFAAPRQILRLFTTDTEMVRIGTIGIRYLMVMAPLIGFTITNSQFFQSIDKPWVAIVTSLSRQVIFLIPMMYVVPALFLRWHWNGLTGVWAACTLCDFLGALLAFVLLLSQWKVFRPDYVPPVRGPRKEAGPKPRRGTALLAVFLFLCAAPQAQTPFRSEKAYLKAMEKRLTEEERQQLQRIYAPTVVGIPPADARADLCVMPDGEIRAYGRLYRSESQPQGLPVYLSSTDCGLSWKQHFAKGIMGSATYFPEWKVWLKCRENAPKESGTFVLRSRIGPEDPSPEVIKVSDSSFHDFFLPQALANGKRVFFTGQLHDAEEQKPGAFFYSDNQGRSFRYTLVRQPKQQEVVFPHQDVRWSVGNGTEPYVCEIAEGLLYMLLRNSTDCFYQSFSTDGGVSWSQPRPSPFQGCNTTPFLLRLTDGRVLVFWNNTRPLAEVDHKQQRNAKPSVLRGSCEDHFTNRDAAHVAISEDGGRTWKGVRELYLNSIRNNADFRYIGTPLSANDKSVHQFQAMELPFNKVLVAVGQNEVSRRMLVFDIDWLYETERYEDFYEGLANVSTQMYLKSEVGHTARNGHCAYNRTHGAIKAMDPTGSTWEVVQLARIEDPRLVSPIQGLSWNFPAARQGEVETELYLAQDTVTIALTDCWFNPCDPYANDAALCSFRLDHKQLEAGEYHQVSVRFSADNQTALLYIDGKAAASQSLRRDPLLGISYLLLQCHASAASEGVYIRSLRKR